MSMSFEIIGDLSEIETIAVSNSIREIKRLRKSYGSGRWRKMKGQATIRLPDGIICNAELHWHEAHERAAEHQLIRVVDESGEDYLFPSDFFIPIDLPKTIEQFFSLSIQT